MNFGEAFSFVFKDPDWFKKVALAALCTLIPIAGQLFLVGWMLEITRRVAQETPTVLPDLDLGQNIVRGLKAWVVGLVYAIPLMIVAGFYSLIAGQMGGNTASNFAQVAVILVTICFSLFALVYGLFLAFFLPAAYGRMVEHDRLGDGFNLGEIFKRIKAAPAVYLIVILGSIVAGIISPLGGIACGIGALITSTYSMAIIGHLYGQAYREAEKNLNIASVIPPSETTFIPPAS